jgi:hypothetical protein
VLGIADMSRNTPYYDEPRGGGAAASSGGGSSSRNTGSVKREVIDTTKGSKSDKETVAREKALEQARREEALSNAKTEGVKTEYPYIEPLRRKNGGMVSVVRRAVAKRISG